MIDNKKILLVLITGLLFLFCFKIYANIPTGKKFVSQFITQDALIDGNNIRSSIIDNGLLYLDLSSFNSTYGFEWPKGSGINAMSSGGLTIAAYVNNALLMSSALYWGEYEPGYVILNNGSPFVQTDSRFHFYKVKRGDNANNNPDWLNWGLMVPYGAPFIDVNHNGIYDPLMDTPGVKDAEQTIFICYTDGFPENHRQDGGFGGGTLPMFNEVHLTAWCYNVGFLQDVQFLKWEVINKNIYPWNSAYFSITSDPDLGCPNDDYIGCDTTLGLGFCYNGEETDCPYPHSYSSPVPAVGFLWLNCPGVINQGLTSVDFCNSPDFPGPLCEQDPNPGVDKAYNFMRGTKNDGSPWEVPPGGSQNITKYCYSGDPESNTGWLENGGRVENCGGPNGLIIQSNIPGDRRLILNSGSDNLTINPGDTHKVLIAQLIARGSDRKNSVTRLKQLADLVKTFACNGFVIGIEQNSTTIPNQFVLLQNYPNPFNPSTIINYQLPKNVLVNLTIFNVLGEKIAVLVNEKQNSGTYKVVWDGTNYPSGIYFYQFKAGDYTKTSKMILLK